MTDDIDYEKMTLYIIKQQENENKQLKDDLAAAYAIGQLKGYPTLLLTNGELNKDAQQSLINFKNLVIKKI